VEIGPASGAIIVFCFGSSLVMYFITKRKLDALEIKEKERLADVEGHAGVELIYALSSGNGSGAVARKRNLPVSKLE